MKRYPIDIRLIMGIILAHFLLYFSYQDNSIFWFIFTGSLLLLVLYSSFMGQKDSEETSIFTYFVPGVLSGLLLYALFWIGHEAILILHLPFGNTINNLYRWYAPSMFWEILALLLVAAPGEELFWRGFIQKRLLTAFSPLVSVLVTSILYASVQIYSGSYLLVFAAYVSGVFWGYLYIWKKKMPLVIISHLVFDVMMFIILPLR